MKAIFKKLQVKQLGEENLVEVFVAVFKIATSLRSLFANFSIARLVTFAVGLIEYAGLITVARQALDEFRKLTPEKAQMVENEVRRQFEIEDKHFEGALEDALGLVVDTYEWVLDGAQLGKEYVDYYNKYIKPQEGNQPRQSVPGEQQRKVA